MTGLSEAIDKRRRSLVGPKGDINFSHFAVQVPLERNTSSLSNNGGNHSRGAVSRFKVKTMPGSKQLYNNIGGESAN